MIPGLRVGTIAPPLVAVQALVCPTLVPPAPRSQVMSSSVTAPITFSVPNRVLLDLAANAEELSSRAFALKSQTSLFASHLTSGWRAGLFGDLDRILDSEEWEFADRLPSVESFTTFMRLVTYLQKVRRPGLGVTPAGMVVAMWADGQASLSIECLPDDHVRWVLSYPGTQGKRERVAGRTDTRKLPKALNAFEVDYLIARQDP